jgi:hypothetical protein
VHSLNYSPRRFIERVSRFKISPPKEIPPIGKLSKKKIIKIPNVPIDK